MNHLERGCLTNFVTEYQSITIKLEQHEKYLEELREEIQTVENEFYWLNLQKEKLLVRFAEVFLQNADKAKKRDKTSHCID